MFFYIFTILFGMTCICALNALFNSITFNGEVWRIVLFTVISTISVILLDGIFATIIRRFLPEKWFSMQKKGFCASKKEKRLYEILGIRKWKDKIMELGGFTNFHKDKIYNPTDNEYVKRYIMEANYGIWCHIPCCVLGFMIMLIPPLKYALYIGLPVACINFFLNLLPIMALRYNLPRLHTLYKYNEKRKNN
jgi:hypothetical protein